MPVDEFLRSLDVRQDFESTPVTGWSRDECLKWLYNEGTFDCGMTYCTEDELREEVLLQQIYIKD